MKLYILLATVFLVSVKVAAQDSTEINVETPKIASKLLLGKTYSLDEIQIKFVDVLTDSRCPEDVTCVWAGEVVILVDILKNKSLLEQRKVVFQPGKSGDKDLLNLFSSEKITITAHNVLPYPNSNKKINREDYYLQLVVNKKE